MSTRRLPSPCPAGRLYPHLWLAFFLCVGFISVNLPAQPLSDTLLIRFPIDSIRINMDFDNNGQRWAAFEHNFQSRYSHLPAGSLRMDIYSGASPEGLPSFNQWLGEQRGLAVRRLLRSHLGSSLGDIVVHNEGARWESFYDLVSASDEPWRDEVLRIIELPPSTNLDQRDHREYKLRSLRGGRVWPILLERYLAPLRNGASAVLSWQHGRDTLVIRDTVWVMPAGGMPAGGDAIVPGTAAGNLADGGNAAPAGRTDEAPRPVLRRPAWILRTNLPFWGVGSPNLQAEWSLGHRDRWSVNVEYIGSWWTFSHNAYANQLVYGSAELRLWLGRRSRHHTLDGFHVGLAAGGGYYDFEWKSKGYQGEIFMGFLNLGWQHRFGKRKQWAFDVGIGLGFLHSPYRRYLGSTLYPESHTEHYDDHLMWQHTDHLNWFGPTHANISIGYVFMPRKGLYRRNKAAERDSVRTAIENQRDAIRERERQQYDSLYMKWYAMPRKQRRAAIKAYKQEQEAIRKSKRK